MKKKKADAAIAALNEALDRLEAEKKNDDYPVRVVSVDIKGDGPIGNDRYVKFTLRFEVVETDEDLVALSEEDSTLTIIEGYDVLASAVVESIEQLGA